jgi:hypothetical protein
MYPYYNCRDLLGFKCGCKVGQVLFKEGTHKLLERKENSQFRWSGHLYRGENKFKVEVWIDEN